MISSGPYKVSYIEVGKKYVLNRNQNWNVGFKEGAPEQITFVHELPAEPKRNENWIVDSFEPPPGLNAHFEHFKLVPEYINTVLLGNFQNGFFSSKENRITFSKIFTKHRNQLPISWGGHTRSETFYPNQKSKPTLTVVNSNIGTKTKPLIIEGKPPEEGNRRWFAWSVLKKTLEELELKYEFAENDVNATTIIDQKYDIRIRGSSIGGGVEGWVLEIDFCSPVGVNFPDPSGRVCDLVSKFEKDLISQEELKNQFFDYVEDDAAILPVSHYGVQLYLSSSIDRSSLSPNISVMRIDQIRLE